MAYEPIVIGLVGPSGGGKTTAGLRIQSYGFIKTHVATPLKRGVREMFGVPGTYCERPLIEAPADFLGGVTPRAVLEHLGDQLHRVAPLAIPLDLDRRLRRMTARLARPWVLVDGIRRRSETDIIHSHGGKVIRILGGAIDPNKPCDLAQLEAEEDFVVNFAPTKEELHMQLDVVLEQILPAGTKSLR